MRVIIPGDEELTRAAMLQAVLPDHAMLQTGQTRYHEE
jgi:hypothetical protein